MKDLFPGYYRKTEAELNLIWQKGIIAFDTNVLLNLYRYSDSTKDTILDLIAKFSDKIWLPYQAALEYNRNRCEVIAEQEKAYKEFITKIAQIRSDLQSTSKPPFLSSDIDKELNESFKKVSTEVDSSIKKYSEYLKDDPIYNRLSELFANKIGENYDDEKLSLIFKEGEERFKNKIPPGFEDEKTKEGNKKYGDLVLWRQIIDKAREGKAIILVTDERKKDWWWNLKDGRLIGPRHELVEEIKVEANVSFHMYSSEKFLSYGQQFLNEQINKKALNEIQALKQSDIDIVNQKLSLEERILNREITFLTSKLNKIDEQLYNMNKYTSDLIEGTLEGEELQKYINEKESRKSTLEKEHRNLVNKLDLITSINEKRLKLVKSNKFSSENLDSST